MSAVDDLLRCRPEVARWGGSCWACRLALDLLFLTGGGVVLFVAIWRLLRERHDTHRSRSTPATCCAHTGRRQQPAFHHDGAGQRIQFNGCSYVLSVPCLGAHLHLSRRVIQGIRAVDRRHRAARSSPGGWRQGKTSHQIDTASSHGPVSLVNLGDWVSARGGGLSCR